MIDVDYFDLHAGGRRTYCLRPHVDERQHRDDGDVEDQRGGGRQACVHGVNCLSPDVRESERKAIRVKPASAILETIVITRP